MTADIPLGDLLRIRKAASAPTRRKVERALRRALKPAPLDTAEARKAERRKAELRNAVREAERKVDHAWCAASKAAEKVPLEHKRRDLNAAMTAAREAAREEIQARWAAEDAEAALVKVDLPPHITRSR